jgi:AcrR family transcriptional regulator
MKAPSHPKPVGRPRSFNKETALDAAMQVFWRDGFEGASLTALTEAMGINRPSLYAAFGDKEALFRQVLDRYATGPASYVEAALAQPTTLAVAEHLLNGAANVNTCPSNPSGCLSIQGGVTSGTEGASIQQYLAQHRNDGTKLVIQRFTRAKAEGDLPADVNPAELARYLVAIIRGMGILAADGASRTQLRGIIQTTLHAWPR